MSAIGSVTAILSPKPAALYQLALRMPGSMPTRANSLKHIRQSPTCRMYARGLPQRLQRLYSRTAKRFGFFQLAILDFLAKSTSLFSRAWWLYATANSSSDRANGTPSNSRSLRPSRSVLAEVTTTTCSPLIRSTELYSISGNMTCSLIPRA